MLVLTIAEASVKEFMNRLLRGEMFNAYEVRGVEINSLTRFEISGLKDVAPEEPRRFCTWAELQPYVFQLLKGNKKPRSIKIIFACSEDVTVTVHPNASALFLNMTYDSSGVTFVTATAQKNFSMDKAVDAHWDEHVTNFFKTNAVEAFSVM